MLWQKRLARKWCGGWSRCAVIAVALALALAGWTEQRSAAQTRPAPPPPDYSQQPAPPEAGGPQGDTGPMAVPQRPPEQAPAPPPKPQAPANMPDYSIRVDVPLVTIPISVTTKDGQFIPGLKKENFRIFEDGVQQNISNFNQQQGGITAVLLVEFASTYYRFMYDALNASYTFAQTLRPEDWIAVIEYDMRPQILVDFTQNKQAVMAALNQLQIPGFSEMNLYDALYDTLDRLDRVQGHKYVVLIGSGLDTFSKLTYDKILKKVKDTKDVTIFTISTGEALRMWIDAQAGMDPEVQSAMMDYLQADNQMRTFANLTGGRWYKPRFEGELPDIFRGIAADIRNEYVVAYRSTNSKQDGTYRKLKVELVAPDGGPLRFKDKKGKDVKVNVIAREGYTAKHQVE